MATRFSFTKEQFAEIKRLQEDPKMTNRQVGEKFDLSERTLRKIKRARTFEEYRRNQRLETFRRNMREEREKRAANERRRGYWMIVWTLILFLAVSLALAGAF